MDILITILISLIVANLVVDLVWILYLNHKINKMKDDLNISLFMR